MSSAIGNILVDFSQVSLAVAAASIAFNPIFWNFVARREYRHRTLTRLFGGRSRRACYALAAAIFGLGLVRDALFARAMRSQPRLATLEQPAVAAAAVALAAAGNVLVLSSMWALGVTGTYLGDYFGILLPARIEGFPFNVCSAPMYYGSSLVFFGTALWSASPAGLLLSAEALLLYLVALRFEDPFTDRIYRERDAAVKRAD